MQCPCCGGPRIQRLQAIYDAGVVEVRAHHQMQGSAWVGPAIHTHGVEQTLLAQKVAPPEREKTTPVGWSFFIGCLFLYDVWRTPYFTRIEMGELVVGCVAILIAFGLSKMYDSINADVAVEYDAWLRSWYCHQCCTIFTVPPAEQGGH